MIMHSISKYTLHVYHMPGTLWATKTAPKYDSYLKELQLIQEIRHVPKISQNDKMKQTNCSLSNLGGQESDFTFQIRYKKERLIKEVG